MGKFEPTSCDVEHGGAELRRIREQRGFSQEYVAERTQINLARLSLIERGKIVKPPSIVDLAELGVLYGLSPRTIFGLYRLPVVKED